ncbi:DNA double-strand break repair nuclease NurA [Salarchaeum sp. JOR-1]|uniref:DNA double-strand break repair nuclease NurA n=1 Tax=Salarchaeum sp. JOR-1 TaxID=2599399 RepID=UPI0011985EEC|nr:DNA double-strand break repair nuclease NurA [Salarchaeum sp. JOR-1]QDX40743.1 DNA double-strand break repair nuclease NurA [Salarchaeum sp. JOR-1]
MTLDPVHFDGITDLVRRVSHDIDEDEHRDQAVRAWDAYFDPLYRDGEEVLAPLGDVQRYAVDIADAGDQPDQFDSVHGLDSGTVNPRTFKNGLVLDIAQAAMGVSPSDTDTHRARTVITTVHPTDDSVAISATDDWQTQDEGYWRGQLFEAPRVERDETAVVHGLALYLAESEHALEHADRVGDLLVLDGPLYPKIIANWLDQARPLSALPLEDPLVQSVVGNYVDLVERFVERGVPLAGFVKNVQSRGIVNTLAEKTNAPWADDAAFFTQLLERRDGRDRDTDDLTYTNWFVSRTGYDREFSTLGDRLSLDLDLDPEAYEVAFFVVYDPRTDVLFKVELPRAFAEDDACRDRLTNHVLAGVAREAGPPEAIGKADELARIGMQEKTELVGALEDALDTECRSTYDDERWG